MNCSKLNTQFGDEHCERPATWRHGGVVFCSIHKTVALQILTRQVMQNENTRGVHRTYPGALAVVRLWFRRIAR